MGMVKNVTRKSMTPNGFAYAIQLTGDRPDLGGLSGATLDEAKSWGKITEDAQAVTVYGDATITLPMSSADYERILSEKGEKSTFQKTKVVAKATADDFAKSFR